MIHLRTLLPLALLAATAAARADITSLSDNFEEDIQGGALTMTTNFTVVNNGDIDLLDAGYFGLDSASYGNVVDLDGSRNLAADLATKETFAPGTYHLSFDLAGSQRGDENAVLVTLGTYSASFDRKSADPFSTETATVTLLASSALSFTNYDPNDPTNLGDNVGDLLDNVSVQAVPEPSTVAALAFGGLAVLRRRNRR